MVSASRRQFSRSPPLCERRRPAPTRAVLQALFLLDRGTRAVRVIGFGADFLRGRVNDITDRSIMAALGRQMTIAVARQAAAAGNLANLDTPGYRTKDAVSFDDVLGQELGAAGALTTTAASHLPGLEGPAAATGDAPGLPMRRDGNNVQLDRELLQMSHAATDFTAAQTAMAAKFRLVRYAIQEGR
jgi:flagellar basal-body rod protein FlgB